MPLYKLQPGLRTWVHIADWRRMKASGYCWYAHRIGKYGYVMGQKRVRGRKIEVFLHRWIMNAPPRSRVFWRNGKHLDNRRTNLVVVPFREEKPYVAPHPQDLPVLRPQDAALAHGRGAHPAAR